VCGRRVGLENGAIIPQPLKMKDIQAVDLSGSSQYVSLPAGIMSSMSDFTIATWVRLDTSSAWSRIVDLGSSTTVNMFLTPQSGSNTLRFAITTSGAGGEQQINAPALFQNP